ncbi:hypothetical protein PHSC3_000886 [Chlamydiales bacterium STE3]|nr:hypothetical protein PHSC3_000886 [Chlamydiales bacterium STE3]
MKPINFPLAVCCGIVFTVHALFLYFFSLSSPLQMPLKTKLAVTTIRLKPREAPASPPVLKQETSQNKPEVAETPSISLPQTAKETEVKPTEKLQQSAPKTQPKPKPKILPKKEEKKPVKTPKKQSSSEKPARPTPSFPPTQTSSLKQQLLAKAQASLGKVETGKKITSSKEPSDSIPTVSQIGTLQSVSVSLTSESLSENEIFYREELASRLKLLLRLPEMGEINVKLTIEKNGTIKKLEILSSESSLNRKYVEKTLLRHTMPCLGKQFGNVENYTFTITMIGT